MSASASARDARGTALWLLAIVAATAILYFPVADYPFLVWDDPDYVSNNAQVLRGLSIDGVVWAFSAIHAANWHPLTWLSHMADVSMFGRWAGGHHLTNVVLHAANSVLLFILLRRYAVSTLGAGVAALVFAVHPLHVESVAWVSERKDVLSGLFWLLTLLAYDRYVRRPSVGRYLPVLVALTTGLLAKQMLITLPLILILLDYWPYRRLDFSVANRWSTFRPLVVEKLPLAFVCLAAIALSFVAQYQFGAVASIGSLSLEQRVNTAALGYVTYLRQAILPLGLSYFYPRASELSSLWALVASIGLLAASAGLLLRRGVPRPWRVGWLWFLISLLPVVGLVQIGQQAHADRYMYLPMIGLLLFIDLPNRGRLAVAFQGTALVVVIGFMSLTYRQIEYWRSSETMYARAVAVFPENCRARVGLANTLLNRRDDVAALPQIDFITTRCEGPNFVLEAALLKGRYLQIHGMEDQALALYQRLAQVFPNSRIAPVRAAAILILRRRHDEAADILWPVREAVLSDQNGRSLLHEAMSASARYRPLVDSVFGSVVVAGEARVVPPQ